MSATATSGLDMDFSCYWLSLIKRTRSGYACAKMCSRWKRCTCVRVRGSALKFTMRHDALRQAKRRWGERRNHKCVNYSTQNVAFFLLQFTQTKGYPPEKDELLGNFKLQRQGLRQLGWQLWRWISQQWMSSSASCCSSHDTDKRA